MGISQRDPKYGCFFKVEEKGGKKGNQRRWAFGWLDHPSQTSLPSPFQLVFQEDQPLALGIEISKAKPAVIQAALWDSFELTTIQITLAHN